MSDNNNASPNESWWVGNFEEGDEWNRRVRQNLQHDAHIRIANDNREEKNTEGDVGRNETANEEGDDADNRAVDDNSEEMDEEGDEEGDEEEDEEEYEENTEGDVGRNESENEEGDDADNRAVDDNSEEMDEEGDEEGDEEEDEEEYEFRRVIRNPHNTEEVRNRYVGLTIRYHDVLGDPECNDELTRAYRTCDDNNLEDDDEPYQYFGTDMNICFFCHDHLPLAEVMALFQERRGCENWSVPTCDECHNPDNRPCMSCQEVSCICEELAANLE